ncbi:MAG: hypothetical protein NVSMB5_03840 [Candidatus Velthaea sp.]
MKLDVGSQTSAAALSGRERLAALARGVTGERHMASIARAAIFEEALLGALRARFNELRTVAK